MRLRRPPDFRRVWKEGRSWAHPLFILWAASNELPFARVGLTASRKVGHAVARNRARRLLREAARRLYVHVTPGWDLVLVARGSLLGENEQSVETAMEKMLQRAGLWIDGQGET